MGFRQWVDQQGRPLIRRSYEHGIGLIVTHENRYLFTIGHERFWTLSIDPPEVTYSACGGHREFGESFPQCAQREGSEELGIEVELIPSPETVFYRFRTDDTEKVGIRDTCAPWLIYDMPVRRNFGYSVCVYPARLSSTPFPSREVPALLYLTPQQVVDTIDRPLDEFLRSGAEIVEQRPVPRNAIIKPFGTARILKGYTSNQLPLISSIT
ncbi:NUDIX domain-containing protein [Candidatus Shapirobacteria bacterium]|nr:NUDIX domain-containing protein [Candidatus Shapirobacteria bacterium]